MSYLETFLNGFGYAGYLLHEITHPHWRNYFYWLILVSTFFFLMELLEPWREKQPRFRKDFWLDFFYMFFNFFLFSLIIYNAASDVVVRLFNDIIQGITAFDLQASNPMRNWPMWAILLTGFVVRDFVQWWTHRLLHRFDFLWQFHKVHHSVEQMGFAAHLRYHWMETVVYKSIQYIPLAMIGFGLDSARPARHRFVRLFYHSHLHLGSGALQPFEHHGARLGERWGSGRLDWAGNSDQWI